MKKFKMLLLSTVAIGLVACGSTIGGFINDNNGEEGVVIKNRLAYQATTSLASLSSFSFDDNLSNSSLNLLRKRHHSDRGNISQENKAKIESLLPTLNVMLENDNNFESVIYESDREEYDYQQTISLSVFAEDKVSYTLYYNIGSEDSSTDVEDLPENPEDIVVPPSSEQTPSEDGEVTDENIPQEEGNVDSEIKEKFGNHHDNDHDDKDYKDDFFHRDPKDRDEKVTVFGGIALVGEEEYPFVAKSSEEIDDDEVEKKFALKIFTSSHRNSIKVVHEIEEDDDEVDESYKYTVKEGRNIVHSFAFENETEIEKGSEESHVKLILDNERFSFKIYEYEGETYIRVKFDKRHEDEGKLIYKKILTENEDGTVSVSFEEVI